MAARQLWVFLSDADVADLLARLERRDPGILSGSGRYLRGDPALLRSEPAALERRESLPGEARLYLFHRKFSRAVIAHPQPAGPFAGWSQLDEERSDCLVLRTAKTPAGTLEPARLYCYVNFWRGVDKERKEPLFTVWASQTLKALAALYPPTAVSFMRIGPDALARSRRGEVRLVYLQRPIAPEPVAGAPAATAPEGTVTPDED